MNQSMVLTSTIFCRILKIFLFDLAHHDLKLTSSASFEIHGEPGHGFIHSLLKQESKTQLL